MKRIIENVIYNTETAMLIAEDWNGLGDCNFKSLNEEIYKTKNEKYFLLSTAGPLTKYGKANGKQIFGSSRITSMSKKEAYDWLKRKDENEAIEEFLPDEFEKAKG